MSDQLPLDERLRADLLEARRRRDQTAIDVLRNAIAVIENAAAVPAGPAWPPTTAPAEVPRREVGEPEMLQLVEAEVDELSSAVEIYERTGQGEPAARARAQRDLLAEYLRP